MSAVAARPPRQRLGEEERRAQIVRATLVVLAGRGYEQASLARIAAEAGVSKGLVSHYFADKETLLEETARLTAARVRDSIAAELDLTAPVPDVIRAAIRRVAHLSSTHHVELKAIREIVPNLRRPDGALRLDLSAYEETYQAQEQLFRRGQDEGTLRAFDTRVMAATYQGAIDTMLGYLDAYPATDADAYAETLADLLVAARHPFLTRHRIGTVDPWTSARSYDDPAPASRRGW